MSPSLHRDCRLQSCDTGTVQSPCISKSTTSTFQEQQGTLSWEESSDTPGSGANVGSACLEPAVSLCPPTPFPTHSGQEREQERARMALRACKCRQGCPAGWVCLASPFPVCWAQHGSARHCMEGVPPLSFPPSCWHGRR